MKRIILSFVTVVLLVCNPSAQAQGDEPKADFYNGVIAYREFRFEEAAEWFLRAAEQGDVEAQFLLGRMHYDGNSLSIDNVTAYMWFDIAAGNGLRAGVRYRDGIADRMTEDEVTAARQRANAWRTEHPASER